MKSCLATYFQAMLKSFRPFMSLNRQPFSLPNMQLFVNYKRIWWVIIVEFHSLRYVTNRMWYWLSLKEEVTVCMMLVLHVGGNVTISTANLVYERNKYSQLEIFLRRSGFNIEAMLLTLTNTWSIGGVPSSISFSP